MSKSKYVPVKISGVIAQVAETTDIPGYTKGVIEIFYPSDEELEKMTDEQANAWVEKNNRRMELICDFMNKNDL